MTDSPDDLRPIPWHGRLSVRLAALVLATHVLFLFAMPWLYRLGRGLFGPEPAASLVGLTFAAIFGALTSFAVSRLVARRISRLAEQVAVPFRGEGDLPGPFDDTGRDEIALLARAMNLTRERAEYLIRRLNEREVAHRTWVAQVSHDLRTPLTALMMCFDRADMEVAAADCDEELRMRIHELVAAMRADAKRVNTLADALLDVARLDMGDELVREPVPPAELVRHVVEELGPLTLGKRNGVSRTSGAAGGGPRLEVEIEPGLPLLQADGERLMRALGSLVRNALEHARERVEVRTRLTGATVRFEVCDDGAGFPGFEDLVDLRRLASQSRRADSARLGLVIAHKIMQAHGGRLAARNLPGGGALVWLELSVPDPDPDEDTGFDIRPLP